MTIGIHAANSRHAAATRCRRTPQCTIGLDSLRIVGMNEDAKIDLAPAGLLRAAINFGNPVLARREPDGSPGGITADLARELARRLDVRVAFVDYEQAGDVFAGLDSDAWDVCFLAIEPVRAASIAFTDALHHDRGRLPRPGAFVAAASGGSRIAPERASASSWAAPTTCSSRASLKHAELVRRPGPDAVSRAARGGARRSRRGVKPALEADARRRARIAPPSASRSCRSGRRWARRASAKQGPPTRALHRGCQAQRAAGRARSHAIASRAAR